MKKNKINVFGVQVRGRWKQMLAVFASIDILSHTN